MNTSSTLLAGRRFSGFQLEWSVFFHRVILNPKLVPFLSPPGQFLLLRDMQKGSQEEHKSPQKHLYTGGRENIFPSVCLNAGTTPFTRWSLSCATWDVSWSGTITTVNHPITSNFASGISSLLVGVLSFHQSRQCRYLNRNPSHSHGGCCSVATSVNAVLLLAKH